MSNFVCEICGTVCIDSPQGYVTGCKHYPTEEENDNNRTTEGNSQDS